MGLHLIRKPHDDGPCIIEHGGSGSDRVYKLTQYSIRVRNVTAAEFFDSLLQNTVLTPLSVSLNANLIVNQSQMRPLN